MRISGRIRIRFNAEGDEDHRRPVILCDEVPAGSPPPDATAALEPQHAALSVSMNTK